MFQKLRCQLMFFCTLAMGTILAVMTVICLHISELEIRNRDAQDFKNNVLGMLIYLENQPVISMDWISQMESASGFFFDIQDNGARLLSSTLKMPAKYEAVFEKAREFAEENYQISWEKVSASSRLMRHEEFSLTEKDQKYWVSVAVLPRNTGVLQVMVLSPGTLRQQIVFNRLLFGTGSLLAFGLLTVLAWGWIGRMVRPVEESRRKQIQFVAAASHELRSPLTVMLSSLSAMRRAEPEEADHFADVIETEGQRMARLIRDMLTLSRADSQTWSISPELVEPDTLLLETYEKYEPLAVKKRLRFTIELPDCQVPFCPCDKERIHQLLSILLDNAFSYTPAGGAVRIRLCVTSGLEISVSDNGPGIPEKERKRIFERFYRADAARQDKEHFGLGLCIAREIVRLHHGEIRVGDAEGGGAVFTITLPMAAEDSRIEEN